MRSNGKTYLLIRLLPCTVYFSDIPFCNFHLSRQDSDFSFCHTAFLSLPCSQVWKKRHPILNTQNSSCINAICRWIFLLRCTSTLHNLPCIKNIPRFIRNNTPPFQVDKTSVYKKYFFHLPLITGNCAISFPLSLRPYILWPKNSKRPVPINFVSFP